MGVLYSNLYKKMDKFLDCAHIQLRSLGGKHCVIVR
nr:MAG TPA: hypothetical protein [Caudoviricetes sp.]